MATISDEPAAAWVPRIEEEYTAKYDVLLQRLDLTTTTMADRYSTVIEMTPHKLIAW